MLPFISVSCGGSKVASFSGCSLTTGTKVDSGFGKNEDVKPDINLILLWLCSLSGLLLGLFMNRKFRIIKLIVNGGGLLLVLIFIARVVGEQNNTMGVTVNVEGGVAAVFFFLVIALVWNIIEINKKIGEEPENIQPVPVAVPEQYVPRHAEFIFCPNCSTKLKSYAKFCTACGNKIVK